MTAALLPNAKAQFIDSTGKPLVGGKVYFYIPNTSTLKDTYQDATQTILNTNPVVLDANGQAIIWGVGTYRQVVYDQYGNLIWDQITEDMSAGIFGNFGDDVFLSGTGFTPGVTTQLTLSANYGSVDNVWVFFDGVWQGLDQLQSLSGNLLTFSSAIPIGVSKVYVKGGTTLAMGIPSAGSVGDSQIAWAGILNRVVDTIASLRSLAKGVYTRVFVAGYYTVGDGGGGHYRYDPSDTTSADNGGTVIVTSTGARFKLIYGAQVCASSFGVIPGLADVSASLNAALSDHVGKYRLLLPQGTLNCANTIDIPAGADVIGTGPVNSNYGPTISQSPNGTVISSTVANAWAVRVAYNTPVVAGGTNVANFEVTNSKGKGFYCQSMATGAVIRDIVVHDCLQAGAQFSYFQDSSLINFEVVKCGAGTDYGIKFDTNCNASRIDKLLVIQCQQPFWMDGCTFMDFYQPHIEQGEYPSAPNNVVNCTFIAGGFKLTNCQHVNFYGGVFVPNSSTYLAAQYSIAESATPFYFTTDNACKNIKMFGPKFSSPENGSRFLTANNLEIFGGTFNAGTSTVTCIEGTNVKLKGGQVELYDNQTQTNMLFTYLAGASEITDFSVICSNPSSTAKTSGALFDGGSLLLGNYQVTIDKYFTQMSTAVKYRGGMGYGGLGYSLAGGTIDITKQNAGEAIVLNTVSGALLSLVGYHGTGTKYTVVNNTAGSLTVGTGGNISTPSPITVPAYGSIDIKHIPSSGALSPVV